jgi:hypothetical protein
MLSFIKQGDDMFRINVLILIFGAFFLSSCGPAEVPKPDSPKIPALEGKWVIRMTQSGGIMGMSQSIEIRSDGSYTATDIRTDKTLAGQLSEGELTGLIKQVASVEFLTVDVPEQYGCADCFLYDLQIAANDQNFSVQLNDISLPQSGLESLVMDLREIMTGELR